MYQFLFKITQEKWEYSLSSFSLIHPPLFIWGAIQYTMICTEANLLIEIISYRTMKWQEWWGNKETTWIVYIKILAALLTEKADKDYNIVMIIQ